MVVIVKIVVVVLMIHPVGLFTAYSMRETAVGTFSIFGEDICISYDPLAVTFVPCISR